MQELNLAPASDGDVTFVQMSDRILTDPAVSAYHRGAYSKMPGYYFPKNYMEIPYWIPTIAGMMPDDRYDKSLHIVTDVGQSIDDLAAREDTTLLFSVMEANKGYVRDIVQGLGNRAVMGGYVDPSEFTDLGNVQYLNSLADLPRAFGGLDPEAPPDYSLFAGEQCIPRLTLSTGCNFMCKFCTVPMGAKPLSPETIDAQVDALQPLDFELIYLDDKSFGQAENWRQIEAVRNRVRTYNPNFSGFIAQTPPTIAIRGGFLEEAMAKGLKYLETGVETVDDRHLRELKKPYRVKHLDQLCEQMRGLGLPLIPNLIFGLPGDDYEQTVAWIGTNRDIIPLVNISFLATHYGSERGGLSLGNKTVNDCDQNSPDKSWLDPEERQRMLDAMNTIYAITRGSQ